MNMNIRVRGGREEGDVYHTHIHALLTSKKPRGRTHIRMERRGKRIKRWQIRDKSIARTRGFNTSLINLSLTNERCGKGVGRKQSSLALRVNIKRNVERKDAMARV